MSASPQARQRRRTRPPLLIHPAVQWVSIMGTGILLLIIAAAWLATLERELPDIRTPRDPDSSSVLQGHALMTPGFRQIHAVDTELDGDWVSQEIGESDWLATELEGSRLRAAFYGTDVYLMARVGPDASRAYVSINQQPVEHLSQDEIGSYVSLWAGQASDQPVLLASNLAHGEHLVEVIAGGDGELAIAGFDVRAATPLPWAFLLAYAGVGGGLFLILRSTFQTINMQSSSVIQRRTPESRRSRESRH